MFVVTPGQKEAKLQTSGDIRNIAFILPDKEKLLVGTDKILYSFIPDTKQFHWLSSSVNGYLTSGVLLDDGTFMLGTSDGVFRFGKHTLQTLYRNHPCIYLDNFSVFHQPVTVSSEKSPLQLSINYTGILKLNHNQNTFSFTATSINYDAPEGIVYSWKLNNQAWTTPTSKNLIHFSNLSSGKHLVSVRALSVRNGKANQKD